MINHELPMQPQRTYVPAIAIMRATLKHSWGRISVATAYAPQKLCGKACRIGYTGKDEDDLAIYRLKIKIGDGIPTVTLPGLYIIENGKFVEYEQ